MRGVREDSLGIDTDLYSRQIGAFGMEMMGKLVQLRVLITGLNGQGVECAKNLILAGPRAVGLHDPKPARGRDLGSMFTFGKPAIKNRLTRAEASVSYLSALNQYVHVEVEPCAELSQEVLHRYDALVVCEGSATRIEQLNVLCRSLSPPRGFVCGLSAGLCLSVFTDFGPSFRVLDPNGEEPKETIIAGVTHEETAAVHTHTDKPLPFEDGDFVTFREIKGMEELNNAPPQKIKLLGRHSFLIGDTRAYGVYTAGGIARQVKMPKDVSFRSFRDSVLHPIPEGDSLMVVPDLAKFSRPEQLHFCFMALLSLLDERQGDTVPHPVLYSETAAAADPAAAAAAKAAADQCVARAKEIAQQLLQQSKEHESEPGVVVVETLEEDILEHVIRYSACCLSPIASFIGGVIAQEVVKLTGKYTPLRGFLYIDALECLLSPEQQQQLQQLKQEAAQKGSLLDWPCADQVGIWGEAFQTVLGNSKIFVVGAGALGCELLKGLTLMGAACGDSGKLTITDMDRIEVSNLNRQFLFRREHVGQSKSTTAAKAAQAMNNQLKVEALEARVGVETEGTIFNEQFWQSQDVIVNALDNIQARQYVDSRCVVFTKPLLESGTLGTKANVQVVVPHLTQCYSDSVDPPEESIPLCTLRHFPHSIEHTIEWSRDAFQGIFTANISEASQFAADPKGFLAKVGAEGGLSQQVSRLEQVAETLSLFSFSTSPPSPPSFAKCVSRAVLLFNDMFNGQIRQLLAAFPLDHRTNTGALFWSAPKRPPRPIEFDANNPLHSQFVLAAANLFAHAYGVAEVRDLETVKSLAAAVEIPPFVPKNITIKIEETEEQQQQKGSSLHADILQSQDEEAERLEQLKAQLLSIKEASSLTFVPEEFEKDVDSNLHVDFVHAAAMLRAENYAIAPCDKHKTKIIAGRIIPAVATTTAMTTGLVCLELLKVVLREGRKIEHYKNAFINLALPLWLFSEPMPPIRNVDKDFEPVAGGPVRAIPQGFTCWDKVEVDLPGCRVKDLIDYLGREFDVNVDIISFGNFCLFNGFLPAHKQKRLNMPIVQLVEEVTKAPAPNVLLVESSCNSKKDSVDVLLPTIAIINAQQPKPQ